MERPNPARVLPFAILFAVAACDSSSPSLTIHLVRIPSPPEFEASVGRLEDGLFDGEPDGPGRSESTDRGESLSPGAESESVAIQKVRTCSMSGAPRFPSLGAHLERIQEWMKAEGLVYRSEKLRVCGFGTLPLGAAPKIAVPKEVVCDAGQTDLPREDARYLRFDLRIVHPENDSLRYDLSLTFDRLAGALALESFLWFITPVYRLPRIESDQGTPSWAIR